MKIHFRTSFQAEYTTKKEGEAMENSKKLENSTLAIILSVISILINVFFNGEKLLRNLCWLLEKIVHFLPF